MLGQTINGYEIYEQIGFGGQGAVYKAREIAVGRDVAIKVILPAFSDTPAFIQRFETEASLIAQLEHPHIIPLYSYWRDETGAFLVMRYLGQGSLRSKLRNEGALSLEEIHRIMTQLVSGLAVAHKAGVVHRDIKPDNILFDAHGNIYLSDFGIARILNSDLDLTDAGAVVGSPGYLSPEQIRNEEITPRTDIYSLGIILFEMLTGKPPFQDEALAVISRHLTEPVPDLSEYRPDLPIQFNDIIQKATAKNPDDRFADVGAFLAAIDAAMALVDDGPKTLQLPSQPTEHATVIGEAPVRAKRSLDYPKDTQEKNRSRILQKVRAFWIDGVLNKSLHSMALLALDMAYKPDEVDNPWEMVLQQPDEQAKPLPRGTHILDVFNDMNGELLILGEPGSGKTTTLLELARDLLDLAEDNSSHPLPIVFNLSSWALNQPPLETWLAEELNTKYQVPTVVAQEWVENEQILPLLDGLDEVKASVRNACVDAINTYRSEHGFSSLVVCSRIKDYQALSRRLKLQGAVVLKPLDLPQVQAYLASFGPEMEAVQNLLADDPQLQELVRSPLMLNIVMRAYRDVDPADFAKVASLEARRGHLFETYVDKMLARRGGSQKYSPEETQHYLTWLARQMVMDGQSVFHIESLQPETLGSKRQRRIYDIVWSVVARFDIILTLSFFAVFLFFGIGIFNAEGETMFSLLSGAMAVGCIVMIPIVLGISRGRVRNQWQKILNDPKSLQRTGLARTEFMLQQLDLQFTIVPVENVGWSWKKAFRNYRDVFLSHMVPWSPTVSSQLERILRFILLPLTIVMQPMAIIVFFLGMPQIGLINKPIPFKTQPNQAIRQSALNVFRFTLVWFLVCVILGLASFVFGLYIGIFISILALAAFFIGQMIIRLNLGGIPVAQHIVLREMLRRNGVIPGNYADFLDHASERILMRKVGGGYIFMHRLLLEYFASLEFEQAKGKAKMDEDFSHLALDEEDDYIGLDDEELDENAAEA